MVEALGREPEEERFELDLSTVLLSGGASEETDGLFVSRRGSLTKIPSRLWISSRDLGRNGSEEGVLSRKSGLETEEDCRDLGIEGCAGHSSTSVMPCGALAQWLRRPACSYLYEVGRSVCLAFAVVNRPCAYAAVVSRRTDRLNGKGCDRTSRASEDRRRAVRLVVRESVVGGD